MDNVFIKYIQDGKIHTLGELKRVYRRAVMKTHPDSVGSERLVGKFIEFGGQYEEAKRFLGRLAPAEIEKTQEHNFRLSFFQELKKLHALELSFTVGRRSNEERMGLARDEALSCFLKWKGDCSDLYLAAAREYEQVRKEKPAGPYRKHELYFNLRPVFHNIIFYHLTAVEFYRRQMRQNLSAIMQRLEERNLLALRDFLRLLIDDVENGPALLG